MTDQTVMMCRSLPRLAQIFRDADGQGHDWVVVEWRDLDPSVVTITDMRPVKGLTIHGEAVPNLFSSRTAALRASEKACKHFVDRDEKPHMGVWKWH